MVYEADTILAEAERRLAPLQQLLQAAGQPPTPPPPAAPAAGTKHIKQGVPAPVAAASRGALAKPRLPNASARLSSSSSRGNGVLGGMVPGPVQQQQWQQQLLSEAKELQQWAGGMKARLAR